MENRRLAVFSFAALTARRVSGPPSEESQTFGEAAALSALHHHGEDDDAEGSDHDFVHRASDSGSGNYGGSTAFILLSARAPMFVRFGGCCLTARRLTSQATIYTITSIRSDVGEQRR
jgi:hypothetical protein